MTRLPVMTFDSSEETSVVFWLVSVVEEMSRSSASEIRSATADKIIESSVVFRICWGIETCRLTACASSSHGWVWACAFGYQSRRHVEVELSCREFAGFKVNFEALIRQERLYELEIGKKL